MMNDLSCKEAEIALKSAGYVVAEISQINEGSNHYVFLVTLDSNKKVICKFAKTRKTEENISQTNRDTLFNGILSLERESYLFSMILKKAKVPTPRVYGIHPSKYGTFIVLQCMEGISHKQYMKDSGYSKKAFLDSMEYLGADFAKVQSVTFSSFGNIMENSIIDPEGNLNFSDRFKEVVDMRIDRCMKKNMFTPEEYKRVSKFFAHKLNEFHNYFDLNNSVPVLIFTDMHAENFFVNNQGHPSGYFDLESAQAAPAALEFYGFRFFLFNFYDQQCFTEAEAAFFKGYRENGGKFAPSTPEDNSAIDFLAGCRLLELSQSYWGHIDGIRDTWGEEMKALLFKYIETDKIDYMAIGDIWRQRDKQPIHPLSI